MKTLELYISKQPSGAHKFICVAGLYRQEVAFTSDNVDAMLAHAVALIEGDAQYEPRLRIYDAGHRMLPKDTTTFVALKYLKQWMAPGQQMQPVSG